MKKTKSLLELIHDPFILICIMDRKHAEIPWYLRSFELVFSTYLIKSFVRLFILQTETDICIFISDEHWPDVEKVLNHYSDSFVYTCPVSWRQYYKNWEATDFLHLNITHKDHFTAYSWKP